MYSLVTVGGTSRGTATGIVAVTAPVTLEAVAKFSFESTGATTPNDIEGHATVYGTPACVEGIKGMAMKFDGTNDYAVQQAYDRIQLGTADFAVEMWFNSTDDAAYMFHKGSIARNDATGTTGKWIGIEYKGGQLKFAVDDNVTKSEAKTDAEQYFDGNWHHLAAVRESATKSLLIYLDGVLAAKATDATGDISDNNEPLAIGNVNVDYNNHYAGLMDELTVYTGAMTANKAMEHFLARGNDGISTPAAAAPATVRLTLIDVRTGAVVATGAGHRDNVTAAAAPGIYILIEETATTRIITKIAL